MKSMQGLNIPAAKRLDSSMSILCNALVRKEWLSSPTPPSTTVSKSSQRILVGNRFARCNSYRLVAASFPTTTAVVTASS